MYYIRKPEQVRAERFDPEVKPWPDGVRESKDLPIPINDGVNIYAIQLDRGSFNIINKGDWIVTYLRNEQKEVYRHDEFMEKFEPEE